LRNRAGCYFGLIYAIVHLMLRDSTVAADAPWIRPGCIGGTSGADHERELNMRADTVPVVTITNADKANIGKRARIINVRFEHRKDFVGREGTIVRALKTRNVYVLELDGDAMWWEAMPQNVQVLT
jgi:hypothetical protein